MVEAGFLATETRRQTKGRPAKVYFTWEGEAAALAEAGVEVPGDARQTSPNELEVELRVLDRMLGDAQAQLTRVREMMDESRKEGGESNG
jgi:hypothetical protein